MPKIATDETFLTRARTMRQDAMDSEKRLWKHLKGKQLEGYKFRRQVTMGPYIVDFLCHEARLIIEVDGEQHYHQAAYDMQRTKYLEKCGFYVLRYWNIEVLTKTEDILQDIAGYLGRKSVTRR